MRSDVGIGLVQAKIDSPDLSDLGIDSFETGYKSATTDALKGCAADLGRCFRPMQNPEHGECHHQWALRE